MTGYGSKAWDVSFQNNGHGWTGSFGLALTGFIENVLTDGLPFEATINYEDEAGGDQIVTGLVYQVENGIVYLRDDGAVEIDAIRRFDA